jgi:putative membrane protein
MMGFGVGMGLFGLLWMILFWGGLILLAIWLVSLLFPATGKTGRKEGREAPSALDILKQRYAQGELTKEQYQEMSDILKQ